MVCGDKDMNMMMPLRGGCNRSRGVRPLVFRNSSRLYPTSGVDEDVPGTAYRSDPNGWMDF